MSGIYFTAKINKTEYNIKEPVMSTPTIELMLEHRSIRSFSDEPIAQEDVDTIMRAAQAACGQFC